jgi:hypothetical protein
MGDIFLAETQRRGEEEGKKRCVNHSFLIAAIMDW